MFLFCGVAINCKSIYGCRVSMLIFMEAISCTCNLVWVGLFYFYFDLCVRVLW